MFRSMPPGLAFLILCAPLALTACGNDRSPTGPGAETFAALAVTPLGILDPGQPVDLQVEAVGSRGTRPFPVDGQVALTVDRGTVAPAALTLAAGTGRQVISLSATDSTVVLTASLEMVTGTASLHLSPFAILDGDPAAPVAGAIPDLPFTPRPGDYRTDHPELGGAGISYNTLLVAFTVGTTVGQANAILTPLQPEIVGGFPGVPGSVPGILVLRVPSLDHATMTAMLDRLVADPHVQVAIPDGLDAADRQPPNGVGIDNTWVWETQPAGGNWGLEISRVPALWNLNPVVEKAGTGNVELGEVDMGPFPHTDLSLVRLNPGFEGNHGTHVAGIMKATFDNGIGMEGVCPYGVLSAAAETTFSAAWQLSAVQMILDTAPGTDVINISLGKNWKQIGVNPGGSAKWQDQVRSEGTLAGFLLGTQSALGREPILCVAAGNESNSAAIGLVEAQWGGMWTYAGLVLNRSQILVVENVQLDANDPKGASRRSSSNIHGFISAPGTAILSTWSGNGYQAIGGTSMASPFVAGVVAYLRALNPSLTVAEIRNTISLTSIPAGAGATGAAASNRIDAYAAALEIDGLRNSDTVVRRLLDIDDGTVDGDRRVAFDSSTDYMEEDADGDGGVGDGTVDMSDFRRWRDWYLITQGTPGLTLDGSQGHPKTDVNMNGFQDLPEDENVWPRGDFNGDGHLSLTDAIEVPGYFAGAKKTDLEMLQAFFDDPDVQPADLPDLIESGDIHVDLKNFIGRLGAVTAHVQVLDGITEAPITERALTASPEPAVLTVATGLSLYLVRVEGLDGSGTTVCTFEDTFSLAPGEDVYLAPDCSNVIVEITLAEFLEPGTPSPLLVRAGLKNGTVTYGPGLQVALTATGATLGASGGSTDADGYFQTEITLADGAEQTTVFATVTDPATGSHATRSASARKKPDFAGVLFRKGRLYVSGGASTPAVSDQPDPIIGQDVLHYGETQSGRIEWTCPDAPTFQVRADFSTRMDYDMLTDASTGYVGGFDLTSTMSASGEILDNGAGCGGVTRNFSTGDHFMEIVLEVLNEPVTLTMTFDVQVGGTTAYTGAGLDQADTVDMGGASPVLGFQNSVMNPMPQVQTRTADLEPGKFYRITIQGSARGGIQNVSDSYASQNTTHVTLVLEKAVAP